MARDLLSFQLHSKEKLMIVTKGDQVVEIIEENVISAFLNNGWKEAKEKAPEAPKPKRKTTKAE